MIISMVSVLETCNSGIVNIMMYREIEISLTNLKIISTKFLVIAY